MIKNIIWSGAFTCEVLGNKAWIDADLAAMPRSKGGLGAPLLRKELMALAATVVASWARDGTTAGHVVGDVLQYSGDSNRAPKVYVAPMEFAPPQLKLAWKANLWDTGREVITKVGLHERSKDSEEMVTALTLLAVAFEGLSFSWYERHLLVDVAALLGSVHRSYLTNEKEGCGTVCTEWLPYLVSSELRLYDGVKGRITTTRDFSRILGNGYRLRDSIHRRRLGAGRIIFTPLRTQADCNPRVVAQLRQLVVVLVTNFHILLYTGLANDALRLDALPLDHPFQARMNKIGQPVARLTADTVSSPIHLPVNS
ncbi:reverse transcriptase [Phytophthora megakarya]|uniref:Reverse transcriptase n=1 Tax=Phytophthora megakarya TaxID=4795 RepID=A0A225VXS3_9STRA|nr:reverse transcriptase [Phytophthora megakarya]